MKTQHHSSPGVSPGGRRLSNLMLYAGFSLTGAGTVLLGVLMPVLSDRWGLRDSTAGFLFFLQFLGCSLGAVCIGPDRVRALRTGFGLLVVCCGGLAFSGLLAAFPLLFFNGIGLGMGMTATSLLFSDRYGDDRAAKLEGLNFIWSAGAVATPALLGPFLHTVSLRPLFIIYQGLYFCIFLWMMLGESQPAPCAASKATAAPGQRNPVLWLLLPLVAMALCSIGVETSISSWLTTYSHRADPRSLGTAALTTSLFLLGFMLSRLAFSTRLLTFLGRRRALYILLACTAACVILLTAAHSPTLIRVAAGFAGLSIGPLYPLLLSFLLERTDSGWIFAAAGVGAVIFPWMTGVLSTHYGSLRHGLAAPCAAALLMILLLPSSFRAAPQAVPAGV